MKKLQFVYICLILFILFISAITDVYVNTHFSVKEYLEMALRWRKGKPEKSESIRATNALQWAISRVS